MILWALLFLRAFALHGVLAWAIGIVYVGYDTLLLAFVAWQTRDLGRSRSGAAAPAAGPATLRVIVAAHNEAAVLPATLAAIFSQDEPPGLVIVADDGSSDATPALLEGEFALARPRLGGLSVPSSRHPGLRWLRLPHGGKPAALNAALAAIDCEIVLTVDADTLLDRHAVAAMRRAFAADPHLVAATGILTPVCGPTVAGRLFQWFQTFEYLRNFLSRYAWMKADSLLLISGAFAGFRAEAVRRVGGFDAACLVEDYELIHRLRRHGVSHGLDWTTAVVGNSRATTEAPGSLDAFLRQRRRWFGGFLQTQFWYRDMIGNRVYGTLGLLMLPVKSLDTMQPIYGLTAFALLIFYLATGRFGFVGLVAGVMGAKLAVDLAFHLWSIRLYRVWAAPAHPPGFLSGLLAALLEPFSFQLCRHLGAALGWMTFLSGRRDWGAQQRVGFWGGSILADGPVDQRLDVCPEPSPMITRRYTRTAIALHWVIAALIFANIALGLSAEHLPDDWVRPAIDLHKSFGITVLGLAVMRVLWRIGHPAPPLPARYPRWERWGLTSPTACFIFLIFCLPLSGWAHDSAWKAAASHPLHLYGVIPWPRISWLTAIDPDQKDYWHDLLGRVHTAFAYVLFAMVGVHVLGALKHQWLDGEPELQRILPGGAETEKAEA